MCVYVYVCACVCVCVHAGRGISVVIPKPMSLEDMQAKGVVLGAAAAAILAAKAGERQKHTNTHSM